MKKTAIMSIQLCLIVCILLLGSNSGLAQVRPQFIMVLSPDGTVLAITERAVMINENGEWRYPIDFWDANTGELISSIEDVPFSAQTMAWHPNGQQLIVGDTAGFIKVWDMATGSDTLVVPGGAVTHYYLAVSPNGEFIVYLEGIAMLLKSISGENANRLWDTTLTDQGIRPQLFGRTWNSTGTQLVTSGAEITDGRWLGDVDITDAAWLWVYDLTPPLPLRGVLQPAQRIETTGLFGPLDLSPDDRYLAAGSLDGQLRIMDTATWEVVQVFQLDGLPVDLGWSPDGEKVAAMGVNTLFVLDIQSGEIARTYAVSRDQSQMLQWHPDGRLYYTGGPAKVVYVDGVPLGSPTAAAGPDQTVTDADSSGSEVVTLDGSASSDPDGQIVAYSWAENGVEITTGPTPTVDLPLGGHTLTLTVTDDSGLTASDEVVITVVTAGGCVIPDPPLSGDYTVAAGDVAGLLAALGAANGTPGGCGCARRLRASGEHIGNETERRVLSARQVQHQPQHKRLRHSVGLRKEPDQVRAGVNLKP